ncbi:Ig-like domain repeat protein [Cellulomonas sp. PhB150]|uniref:Ig-like domain repeat protein n=1 Tax=Cellulomonas sp. PhB150 TaxID=2485188 RepID=UPI000FB4F4E8|nr:Ig-like domain repeat protein [Cellulomonas sp. PhB150]ROS23157.1 Ig-like domain-containing protein [Cellulomonas sp. PhB150]
MRRLVAAAVAVAVAGGAAVVAASPASAAVETIKNATFTWGVSGYAQVGIFGPWTFKDLTGNATQLVGSVSGGSQAEYVVAPLPATSMPVSSPQKTPNAVRFTSGTGTVDPATGASTLSWTGSYTVNAYPAAFNAPNEIYSDPRLTLDAQGSGTLSFHFVLGAGVGQDGQPTAEQDLGRVTLVSFANGAVTGLDADGFTATPAYQGVAVTVPADSSAQVTTCTTDGGATGWWGSWNPTFVNALPSSVRPHFYSTGCTGNQDLKPALPVDVAFERYAPASVTVSATDLQSDGTTEVTVEGTGFAPTLATGTRPPFAGIASGAYVAFGRYADVWKPSAGAPSSARTNPAGANGTGSAVIWAVPAASFTASSPRQDPAAASYTELRADGTFTAKSKVNKAWLASAAGNYGIYTYAGGGPTVSQYETYTPITFHDRAESVTFGADVSAVAGAVPSVQTKVYAAGTHAPSGEVTVLDGTATVGSATLAAGKATVALSADLAVGDHELVLRYAGDSWVKPSESTAVLTVTAAPVVEPPAPTATEVVAFDATAIAGRALTLPVAVAAPGAAVAGTVTVRDGAKVVGSATLTAGRANVSVAALAAGKRSLTVAFAPAASAVLASSTTVSVAVAKAVPAVKVTWPTATHGKAATAAVSVTAAGLSPSGTVTLYDGTKRVGSSTLSSGAAKVMLPKTLSAGAHALRVVYSGDSQVLTATAARTVTVAKAASKSSAVLASSAVKASARGKVTVTIAAAGASATGTVVVTIDPRAKGAKNRVVTGALKAGKVTVTLPKLPKGTYAVAASYAGSANVAGSTAKARTLTVR